MLPNLPLYQQRVDNKVSKDDDDYYAAVRSLSFLQRVGLVVVFLLAYVGLDKAIAQDLVTAGVDTQLTSSSVLLTWEPLGGTGTILVNVGSTVNDDDVFNNRGMQLPSNATSILIEGLPVDGSELYVLVFTPAIGAAGRIRSVLTAFDVFALAPEDQECFFDPTLIGCSSTDDAGESEPDDSVTSVIELSSVDRELLTELQDHSAATREVIFYAGLMGVVFAGFAIGERYGR